MHIAFLYTLKANQALFGPYISKYLSHENITVSHHTDESLLHEAMEYGLTEDVKTAVHKTIQQITASGADIVVCTCSTIGDIAEQTPGITATVIRVDRPMANKAVSYSRVHVLAAVASTIDPTLELLDQCAENAGHKPEITSAIVPRAWPYYFSGDLDNYIKTIARYIDRLCEQVDVIVLAQASMAPASEAACPPSVPILTSPEICLQYLASLTTGKKNI